MSSRFKSICLGMKSSAGDGKPALTPPSEYGSPSSLSLSGTIISILSEPSMTIFNIITVYNIITTVYNIISVLKPLGDTFE